MEPSEQRRQVIYRNLEEYIVRQRELRRMAEEGDEDAAVGTTDARDRTTPSTTSRVARSFSACSGSGSLEGAEAGDESDRKFVASHSAYQAGNEALARALRFDEENLNSEAISAYISAAEHYLQTRNSLAAQVCIQPCVPREE